LVKNETIFALPGRLRSRDGCVGQRQVVLAEDVAMRAQVGAAAEVRWVAATLMPARDGTEAATSRQGARKVRRVP
jgi:hypothetical protein